ncbi:MAG: dihydrodipicolinate synthase family protein [Acidobacteria bacterium]|nr:dihydrodipicolinate synthase family protein [Acidobacteriota bacterium]
MRISGIYACLPTPFDHPGDIYVSKVSYNISRLSDTSLAGFLVSGREGEGSLLADHERLKLWESVKAATDRTVLPAVEAAGVHATVGLIGRAAEMGFEAVVVGLAAVHPSELTSDDTRALYVRSVADRSSLPLVVSLEDGKSENRLSPEQLGSLAQHPRVIGVRVVSSDAAYLRDSVEACGDRAGVFAGSAELLAQGLIDGAAGAMTGFASVAPYLCLSIEEAVRTREFAAAEDLQGVAQPAIEAIRRHGAAGLKYAADLQGYYGGAPRLPLSSLAPQSKADIESAFRDIKS